ncbi:MAG TPA: DUF1841 domain-containing protein [Deltaproteobacteria bacterium]|nr:DUF1841 domain-containing protein [Deltaproteobacteria bacterium]
MSDEDTDRSPDPKAWGALDPEARREQIAQRHPEGSDPLHPEGYPRAFHVGLHVVVEDQLASGHAATRRALERLTSAGLRRHAAMHAIMDTMLPSLIQPGACDEATYADALDALDAAEWLSRRLLPPGP